MTSLLVSVCVFLGVASSRRWLSSKARAGLAAGILVAAVYPGHARADDPPTPIRAVGKRKPPAPRPPRAKLPKGKGWWCFRYLNPVLTTDTSVCVRTKAQCIEGIARLTSGGMAAVVGNLETTGSCRRVKTAWASEAGGPHPMFMIFDSQADCDANLIGDTCKAVR